PRLARRAIKTVPTKGVELIRGATLAPDDRVSEGRSERKARRCRGGCSLSRRSCSSGLESVENANYPSESAARALREDQRRDMDRSCHLERSHIRRNQRLSER